jgi:hypothetical protein
MNDLFYMLQQTGLSEGIQGTEEVTVTLKISKFLVTMIATSAEKFGADKNKMLSAVLENMLQKQMETYMSLAVAPTVAPLANNPLPQIDQIQAAADKIKERLHIGELTGAAAELGNKMQTLQTLMDAMNKLKESQNAEVTTPVDESEKLPG